MPGKVIYILRIAAQYGMFNQLMERRFQTYNPKLIEPISKKNLSAYGSVAKRFKMLTYCVYAPSFTISRLAPNPKSYF